MFNKALVKIITVLATLSLMLTATLFVYGTGESSIDGGANDPGASQTSSPTPENSSTETGADSSESNIVSSEPGESSEAESTESITSSKDNTVSSKEPTQTGNSNVTSSKVTSSANVSSTVTNSSAANSNASGVTESSKPTGTSSETKQPTENTEDGSDGGGNKGEESKPEQKEPGKDSDGSEKEKPNKESDKAEKNPNKEEDKTTDKESTENQSKVESVQSQVTSYYTPSYDAGSKSSDWEGEDTEFEETSSVRELSKHLTNPKKALLKWIWLPVLIALLCIGALVYINVYVYGKRGHIKELDDDEMPFANADDFVYLDDSEIPEDEELPIEHENEDDPYSAENFFHFDEE